MLKGVFDGQYVRVAGRAMVKRTAFDHLSGFVAQIAYVPNCPFPQADLSYGPSDRYAWSGVAIEHSDADLDFRDLSVEVPCHQGLA